MDPVSTSLLVKPAAKLVAKLLRPIYAKIEQKATVGLEVAYHRMFNAYARYLDDAFERYSYFNSVVFKNEQKRLTDYYIPLTLVKGVSGRRLKIHGYPRLEFDEVKRMVIVDTAGMGKTTLLKYLFVRCVEDEGGIPIFVELRKLSKKNGIVDYILDQLSDLDGKCKPELFFKLLSTGEFIFFLDGYDEISDTERSAVTEEIQTFIAKAGNNKFLLSSREEAGLISFPHFQRYSIRPLERDEAYVLLRKYGESKLADILITKLQLPENKGIHEFLSTPLLASLLYKSFEYKHIVPLRKHIFYRQVFESLFETHDLTKEGGEFQRLKRCGLDIDRFEKLLRAMGYLSYRETQLELTKDEALHLVEKAMKLCGEGKVIASNVIHDLTHAVPLMMEDGNYLRWSHRSIQEYFAARYICRDTHGKQATILESLYKKDQIARHLNLISLCADIDQAAFRQAIGKTIAVQLLNEFKSLLSQYNLDPAIEARAVTDRVESIVGRRVFIVRIRTDYPGIDRETKEKILGTEIDSIMKRIASQFGVNPSIGHAIQALNPGIATIVTPAEQTINLLRHSVELPFLRPAPAAANKGADTLDKSIDLLSIDHDPANPVNIPRNFVSVNDLLRSQLQWTFDSAAAVDYVQAIDEANQAQSALEDW